MKNRYEIGQSYLLTLENQTLREIIVKLTAECKELKKLYDEKNNGAAEGMVQNNRENAIIQE
jgi:hypothetical protein